MAADDFGAQFLDLRGRASDAYTSPEWYLHFGSAVYGLGNGPGGG
ncbi:hypothetical protein EDD52_10860 [Primorskyibacter sedentarius]|uniref:Uncharacterized protein n=1 Tax=Primorskyibacter sedentarius TaxID=745311 RepID=A0A4R3JC99_9RHOB|nr:hypothetical protein EDD52_10860 [Primorskyibacter sedentarius]